MARAQKIGTNVVIDGIVTFWPRPGDLFGREFPYPRDGFVQKAHEDIGKLYVCEEINRGKRNKGTCLAYAKLLNEHVDKDMACRWGKKYTAAEREAGLHLTDQATDVGIDIAKIFLPGAITEKVEELGEKGVGIGKTAEQLAYEDSCYYHQLLPDQTIDEIFAIDSYHPGEASLKTVPAPVAPPPAPQPQVQPGTPVPVASARKKRK